MGVMDETTNVTVPKDLPGAEKIDFGFRELAARRKSLNSDAVEVVSARLRAAAVEAPETGRGQLAAHCLYSKLPREEPGNAHFAVQRDRSPNHQLRARALACATGR
jgi:hypothetical protein